MKQVVKASIKMKVTLCSPLGFACRRILIDSPFINGLSTRLWAIHKHRQQVDYHDHNKNQKTRFFRESPEKNAGGRGLLKVIVRVLLPLRLIRLFQVTVTFRLTTILRGY